MKLSILSFIATFFLFAGTSIASEPTSINSCLAGDDENKKFLNCVQTSGHHVYKADKTCAIGGEKYKALQLGTHSTYGRHLDWEPVSYMRFPVPLPVCPSNGFVDVKKSYAKDEMAKFKSVVESSEYKSIYSEKHATFYLYAKLLELSETPRKDMWWLYLNATWEADNCKNEKRYKEYALKVIETGNERVTKVKESEFEYWLLKLIVANMHRRIGDFEKARTLVDKIGPTKLEKKSDKEFFALAVRVLNKAIDEKNTKRVRIADAREDLKKKSTDKDS